jgi:hypothetical protein
MAQRTLVVDSGGTTRQVKADRLFVVDSGGTTRKLKRLFVVDSGGTTRQVYQNATFALPSGTVSAVAGAQVRLDSDGDYNSIVDGIVSDDGDWITPTSLAPGAYTIRFHVNSASVAVSGTVDTDLALSSNRSIAIFDPGAAEILMTLKDGDGNTVATGTVTLENSG